MLDALEISLRLLPHLLGQGFDKVAAAHRIDRVGYAGFISQNLLRAQCQSGGMLGRQGERFVHAVGVQRLAAAQDGRQGLIGHTDQVHFRLFILQRAAGSLSVKAQSQRGRPAGAVLVSHRLGPEDTRRPILGNLLEDIVMRIEEKAEPRREAVDLHPTHQTGIDVSESIRQRKGQLLDRRGAGLTNVIAADAHRVPLRHLLGAKFDHVGDQTD